MTTNLDSITRLPGAARLYVAAVIGAGAALFTWCLPQAQFNQPVIFAGLFVMSAATASLKVYLPLNRGGSTMSVSTAADFVALLLLGPNEAMAVAAAGVLSQCHLNTKARTPPYQTLFSMASIILTVQAAGFAYAYLGGTPGGTGSASRMVAPLLGAAMVSFLMNTGLVATAIALSSRERIMAVWHGNFLWSAPSYFISAVAAALASGVFRHAGFWLAPLAFVPLYLTYRSYKIYLGRIEEEQRHVKVTADLHLATVEALARAIDAKDQPAYTHIWRVQLYATRLAEKLGLSAFEVQGVKTAALLHDIGKLAVPEHILSKPGPLTQEEFQKVRIHPQVGAEIIAAVPFPYPVAPFILSHHERWDGKGYPHGLAGENIPLGARILTIVDYFDAVTTERPYHKALDHAAAVELIKREAGQALDPQLVHTFVELLPSLQRECAVKEQTKPAVPTLHSLNEGAPAAGLVPEATQNAFENIALAHREIYALYEIAQAMSTSLGIGDTMAIISSKLTKIVPWSGCALFLCQPDSRTLKCGFAAGFEAPKLLNVTLPSDGGLEGWVAENRRSLVNANPAVTFEAAGCRERTDLKSAIVCPLFFNETLIGILSVYHTDANRYTEDHRRLLERVAEQAGAVLHNSIVFEQTQEDALTDALTGLPNRRSMFVHLKRELSRADRLKVETALVVVDIDDFKTINDTYGHNIGDRALREVASALNELVRPYDVCVRYAGDEFILVLAECSRETAELRRLELQARINAIELEVRPGKRLRISASAGAAVCPHDGATYEALIAEADRRMYRDKTTRRAAHFVPRASTSFDVPAGGRSDATPFSPEYPVGVLEQTVA